MLWDYNHHTFVSFPTVVGGIVYIGVGSNVSALSSSKGSQLWSISLGKQVGLTPTYLRPAVLDNVLYVGSSDGSVCALNANNGEKIWNRSLGNQSETYPAVANGVVYIGSNDGNLYALNATNGEILWNYTISDLDHAVESSPVVANGVVCIGSGARNVYAFGNPANLTASSDNMPIIIIAVIVVIIVAIAVTLIIKRSKSKPSQEEKQKQFMVIDHFYSLFVTLSFFSFACVHGLFRLFHRLRVRHFAICSILSFDLKPILYPFSAVFSF